ncbi:MAG: OmpA family protein [Flavobacteriales bacterium]|nr:OmpA family protein [Flavobacteriales bacterium]
MIIGVREFNRAFLALFLLATIGFGFADGDEAVDGCAQDVGKKSRKKYNEIVDSRVARQMKMKELRSLLEVEPDYLDAQYKLASYTFLHHTDEKKPLPLQKPLKMYVDLIEACPTFHSEPYYRAGLMFHSLKDYKKAIFYLDGFVKFKEEGNEKYNTRNYDENRHEAKFLLNESLFFQDKFDNPVPFDPKLVEGVSSAADEYLSIVAPDGESVYYTRRFNKKSKDFSFTRNVEEFTKSELVDNGFNRGAKMKLPFNQPGENTGATAISINNKEMFLAVCHTRTNDELKCEIFVSHLKYDKKVMDMTWSDPVALGKEVNADRWQSQPTISGDGKTLYFASIRKEGMGGIDIYKSERDSVGKWQKAVNLGTPINTAGNDKTPFMHPDSETLYFSSSDRFASDKWYDGHQGLGGYDLFFSKYNSKDSTWAEPKNLGYPINSVDDEYGFYVSTDGITGYFSSDKLKGLGGLDLFSFELYKEARPEEVMFLKGNLKGKDGKPLKNASLELRSSSSRDKLSIDVDSIDGGYAMVMKVEDEEEFILSVKSDGSAFNSKFISTKDASFKTPTTIDFEVKPIAIGEAYQLNDIYFETDSAILTAASEFVIAEFIDYLKSNRSIRIAVYGHTDDIGDNAHNLELSRLRAEEVTNYLIEEGIAKSRITFKGKGESQPVASNKTPEGRAKNRRTEFVIISK